MDNLLSAFDNGVPLTRTSSDPNLNKHCQEEHSALENPPATEGVSVDGSDLVVPDGGDGEPPDHSSATTAGDCSAANICEDTLEEPCLTTQPLPSLPLPPVTLSTDVILTHTPLPAPVLQQALITKPPLLPPLLDHDSPCRTAESTTSPINESKPCLPLPCNSTQTAATTPTALLDNQENVVPESEEPLVLKPLASLVPMDESTETLTDDGEFPPVLPPTERTDDIQKHLVDEDQLESHLQVQPHKEDMKTDVVKRREPVLAVAPVDTIQGAARHLISQSHLSDLSMFGSHWESVQGLVQSACSSATHSGISRALQQNTYQSRRLACKLLRSQGFAITNSSQCCRREALCCPSSSVQPGCPTGTRSPSYNGMNATAASAAQALNGYAMLGRQLLPVSYPSASASSTPPPTHAPTYLDDDGLPVPMDAVQQRLRQIEAGYKQEVEVLRQQVRQLQMRLESKQYDAPPSEPDIDYEDDIVSSFFHYYTESRRQHKAYVLL